MVAHFDKKGRINGIICDMCGHTNTDKFRYYSAKLDCIEVDKSIGSKGIADIDRRYLDLDFCASCFGNMKKQVLAIIKKREDAKAKGKSQWSTSAQQHKQNMKP